MSPFVKNIRNKALNHKTLIQNFSYLSALQIFNLILPLITYPYLIRVLGKETYGLVVFAQAIAAYVVIFVGFGFNISATQAVSIHRENKNKLIEIISSVTFIKLTILIVSFLILISVFHFIPNAKDYKLLFILSLWTSVSDILLPVWYFQGIEQMRYITIITTLSRLISILLIFVFINNPTDFLLVPMFYLTGTFISGLVAIRIIFIKHKLEIKWQSFKTQRQYFMDSLPMFISILAMSIFVNSNKVIIGYNFSMKEVAYYDLAEKIMSFFKIPQTILSQTIFPKISRDKNIQFVKKILWGSIFSNAIFILILLLFSRYIITFLGGNDMLPTEPILEIMSIIIVLSAISNILGLQILIPFGYKKSFTSTFIISSCIYLLLILTYSLLNKLTIINLSLIIVLTEISITIIAYIFCKKHKLI